MVLASGAGIKGELGCQLLVIAMITLFRLLFIETQRVISPQVPKLKAEQAYVNRI